MARKLINVYLQSIHLASPTPASETSIEDVPWSEWRLVETMRRTIFLVNIINNLSCRIGKQNPYFYEALDDELVSVLPLPVSDNIWTASSEVEWLNARLMANETDSGMTIRNAQTRIAHPQNQSNSERRTGFEKWRSSLHFTTLILATSTP